MIQPSMKNITIQLKTNWPLTFEKNGNSLNVNLKLTHDVNRMKIRYQSDVYSATDFHNNWKTIKKGFRVKNFEFGCFNREIKGVTLPVNRVIIEFTLGLHRVKFMSTSLLIIYKTLDSQSNHCFVCGA